MDIYLEQTASPTSSSWSVLIVSFWDMQVCDGLPYPDFFLVAVLLNQVDGLYHIPEHEVHVAIVGLPRS